MANKYRVVHYLNQFFGGIGGEEAAYSPVQVKEGATGPARLLQQVLGDEGTVVATIVAGDNYFVEEQRAPLEASRILDEYSPDIVVAGPAFDAGRYGLACAMMCRLAQGKGMAAVTAMHPENVGVITYRRDIIAVPTGTNVSELSSAVRKMAQLALKMARGEELGPAAVEGYIPRGFRKHIVRDKLGYERAVDMLVARTTGQPYESEVLVKRYEDVPPAPPLSDLKGATLGLVTSGGLVPRGNPDRLVGGHATEFFKYSIRDLRTLSKDEWESVHSGFNTTILNTIDPSYALPLPIVREFQDEGLFKDLYPYYFATTGNGTAVSDATRMGREIASELKAAGVSGVLLVAT